MHQKMSPILVGKRLKERGEPEGSLLSDLLPDLHLLAQSRTGARTGADSS